jgi:hypothetical protein
MDFIFPQIAVPLPESDKRVARTRLVGKSPRPKPNLQGKIPFWNRGDGTKSSFGGEDSQAEALSLGEIFLRFFTL